MAFRALPSNDASILLTADPQSTFRWFYSTSRVTIDASITRHYQYISQLPNGFE